MREETLDQIEEKALLALVRLASEGNAGAATGALGAIEKARKTRLAQLHNERMAALDGDGVGMAAYLAALGQTVAEVASWLGRPLSAQEAAAWERARDARLLEVRAVELGRMRRGDGDVPKWALRK